MKELAADFDLDAYYYNKDKLLTYLHLLSESLNLLRAISVTMVSECPKNKREFIKLFKRPKQVQVQMVYGEIVDKKIGVNKACLMVLRNCLARRKVNTEATTASLWDQVADLYIKYRRRRCLDCNNIEEDLVPRETGVCYICSDSMCGF